MIGIVEREFNGKPVIRIERYLVELIEMVLATWR